MTEKYLIALDLDGTLLKDDKTISKKTKLVLNKLKNDGHKIMISTGRPFRSSFQYYQELQLNTPIVNFNGALVHHPLQKSWGIFHNPLDLKVAREIIEASQNFTFNNIVAEVKDDVYLHYEDDRLFPFLKFGNPKILTGDLLNSLQDSPTSMLIQTDREHVAPIQDHLSAAHAELVAHRDWPEPYNVIEVVSHGINKAVGVKKVAEDFGIRRQNIIAFGDELNDLEMLDYVGKGIAMGNAVDKLKNIAKEVTLNNEEDGIGLYLAEYFNLKL